MKHIVLFLFTLSIATGLCAQKKYERNWDSVSYFLANFEQPRAYDIAQQSFRQALHEDNSRQMVTGAFYLAIMEKNSSPGYLDSIPNRYLTIMPHLAPADRAICQTLLAVHYIEIRANKRIMHTNDSIDYLLWSPQRIHDTICALTQRVADAAPMLRQVPLSRYARLLRYNAADTGILLTRNLYDALILTLLYAEPPVLHADTSSAVALPLAELAKVSLPPDASLPLRLHHILAADHCHDALDVQLQFDLLRTDNYATLPQRSPLRATMLRRCVRRYADQPEAGRFYAMLADYYRDADSLLAAQACCDTALQHYPHTFGADRCANIRNDLHQPHYAITYPSDACPRLPLPVVVKYKNIDTLHFRLYARLHDEKRPKADSLLSRTPLWETAMPLPHHDDLCMHQAFVSLPPVPAGKYYLMVSDSSAFTKGRTIFNDYIHSHNLAIIPIHGYKSDNKGYIFTPRDGHLVDFATGLPVADQAMTYSYNDPDSQRRTITMSTDTAGFFTLTEHTLSSGSVLDSNRDPHLSTNYLGQPEEFSCSLYYNIPDEEYDEDEDLYTSSIITDRPIYHPGDTVHFSALFARITDISHSRILKHRQDTFCLWYDNDDDPIDTLCLTADDQGRMSGHFVLPDKKVGNYILGNYDYDETRFVVEEYKQPTFQITLLPDSACCRKGQDYTLRGTAMSLTGAPLVGAEVRYKVNNNEDDSTYSGTTNVDAHGCFTFTLPTAQFDNSEHDYIRFRINIEVTDLNGESQAIYDSRTINRYDAKLDFQGLEHFTVNSNVSALTQWDMFTFACTNANSAPMCKEVHVHIERLRQPDTLRVPMPQTELFSNMSPGISIETTLPIDEFRRLYPGFTLNAADYDAALWPVANTVLDTIVTTDGHYRQHLPLPKGWPSGCYRITLSADHCPTTVHHVVLQQTDCHSPVSATKIATMSIANQHNGQRLSLSDQDVISVGDTLHLDISSPLRQQVYVAIYNAEGGRCLWQQPLLLDNEVRHFAFPVTEKMCGQLQVVLTAVRQGMDCYSKYNIVVPKPDKQLDIHFETFRNTLTPGQTEQCTFRITRCGKPVRGAGIIADMYDASLNDYVGWNYWHMDWLWGEYYYGLYFHNSMDHVTYDYAVSDHPHNPAVKIPTAPVARRQYTLTFPTLQGDIFNSTAITNGTIRLIVTDAKTGESLPFANVVVKLLDGTSVKGAQTDFDGYCTIKGLTRGKYDLTISMVGYNKNIIHLIVASDVNTVSNLATRLIASTLTLESVQVVDTKVPLIEIGVAESGMRISSDDIAMMPGCEVISEAVTATAATPIRLRSNFSTLAFFRPDLTTDRRGRASFRFTVPDLFTRWRCRVLAWTDDLAIGYADTEVVAHKELMVQPDMPRFLRQADSAVLLAKVVNLTDQPQQVEVTLAIADSHYRHQINLQPNGVGKVSFPIVVADTATLLDYQITACGTHHTDGLQGRLPVMPRRQLVTESMALYVNGPGSKHYAMPHLSASPARQPVALTAECTSNPVWYAVQALPYFAELENPSNLYRANSLYTAGIAAHLISHNPAIDSIFHCWQQQPAALASPLAANADVKSTLLDETPYLRDALNESTRHQMVANYFDSATLHCQIDEHLNYLSAQQLPDGGFSWLPKDNNYVTSNRYITRSILQPLAQLRQLDGTQLDTAMLSHLCHNGLDYLHRQAYNDYAAAQHDSLPQHLDLGYLYLLSLMPDFKPADSLLAMLDTQYILLARQAFDLSPYNRARAALLFHRHGDTLIARQLIASLRSDATTDDEMGRYWRDNVANYGWQTHPVEAQALLIQAFTEITPADTLSVTLMRQWLLKHKQGNRWNTDVATAHAVQALIADGSALLAPTDGLTLALGGQPLSASRQAGTGYQRQRFSAADINPAQAQITMDKSTAGPAWGALYYQYFADLDSVAATASGISIQQQYYRINPDGSITPSRHFRVGDRVRVRFTLRTDRTMQYVQLKAGRAACFEPVSTRSGWCWNDGLRYYSAIHNTADNCYIDHLNPGLYTVEYDLWTTLPGTFTPGLAAVQCLYAPEFGANAPSAGTITVEP